MSAKRVSKGMKHKQSITYKNKGNMSQEDARGLGKTIDFMRAVSLPVPRDEHLLFLLSVLSPSGLYQRHSGTRILVNLQRDTGLFTHSLVTKSFCLMFLFFLLDGSQGTQTDGDVPGGVSAVS